MGRWRKGKGLCWILGVVVCLFFGACSNADYPWYEQILRQDILTTNCDALGLNTPYSSSLLTKLDHILVDHNHKLLYCYVPKVACTNWKRVLMVLSGKSNSMDLSQISASLVHTNGSLLKLTQLDSVFAERSLGVSPDNKQNIIENSHNNIHSDKNVNKEEYYRLIVVRHPFERLLSAYRNKLEDSFPSAKYFQARIGRHIIKKYRPKATKQSLQTGADVTFREFVQYLIAEGMSPDNVNEHWRPIYQMCHPCILNYTFIAKYERLIEDAEIFLDMINASNIQFPQSRPSSTNKKLKLYFQQLSLDEIEKLYNLYKIDFKLFGYDLQDILGYDIG